MSENIPQKIFKDTPKKTLNKIAENYQMEY